ncbi:MAG TPA: hypothetical protein VJ771_09095 [Candidatus Nitrosotalea sp.]|nr:hypothetical protein [Candidatus Nitrosotalea sp.]
MSRQSTTALFYQGASGPNDTRATLVSVSIEVALLVTGVETYEKVVKLLKHDYNCHILNCYKHPEYLNTVLSKLEDKTRYRIIKIIKEELGEYAYIKQISKFLYALRNN